MYGNITEIIAFGWNSASIIGQPQCPTVTPGNKRLIISETETPIRKVILQETALTPVIYQTLHLTIPVFYSVASLLDFVRGCLHGCACTFKWVERAISHNLVLNLASEEKDIKTLWVYLLVMPQECNGESFTMFVLVNNYHKYWEGTALASVSNWTPHHKN